MKNLARATVALGLAISLGGCATIAGGGSSQPITLQGTPSEATYTIHSSSGIQMSSGTLPTTVSLPRKNEYQIDVALDGYETQTTSLSRGTNGWVWGNLVFGWIVGFIVDFATGSAYKLQPAVVNVTLDRGDEVVAVLELLSDDGSVITTERLTMKPLR